jgi:hypothetical protein
MQKTGDKRAVNQFIIILEYIISVHKTEKIEAICNNLKGSKSQYDLRQSREYFVTGKYPNL